MPRTRHRGTLRLSQTVRRTAVDERVASVFEAEARYRIGCVGEDRRVGGHAELDPRVETYGGDRRLPSAAGPGGLHAVSGDGGRSVREAVPSSWVCAPSGGVWVPARRAWAPELHSRMTAARSIAGPAMLRPASWWRPANRGGRASRRRQLLREVERNLVSRGNIWDSSRKKRGVTLTTQRLAAAPGAPARPPLGAAGARRRQVAAGYKLDFCVAGPRRGPRGNQHNITQLRAMDSS